MSRRHDIDILFSVASFHGTDAARAGATAAGCTTVTPLECISCARARARRLSGHGPCPADQLDRRARWWACRPLSRPICGWAARSATAPGSTTTSTPPTCSCCWTQGESQNTANITRPGRTDERGHKATGGTGSSPNPAPRPAGWALVALRAVAVTVLLLGVILILPLRFAERLLTGPRRPSQGHGCRASAASACGSWV